MLTGLPNPGSAEAVAGGCNCPRMDNAYGEVPRGHTADGTPMWIVRVDCPMHGEAAA